METVWLRTLSVLFFIELSTRKVHLAGRLRDPRSAWMAQQARNLATECRLAGIRFLVRDRDAKSAGPFDEVFRGEGLRIIRTPIRSPKANAIAERFVETVRRECFSSRGHRGFCTRPGIRHAGQLLVTAGQKIARDRLRRRVLWAALSRQSVHDLATTRLARRSSREEPDAVT